MRDDTPIIEVAARVDSGGSMIFESRQPYDPQRIRAAAIYCSDGRFGAHCDDFLHHGLNLPRYDRLVIPGGPGNLAGHFMVYREGEAIAQQLQFLIEAHGLERVVLIGHEGCAFYTHRLYIAPADLMERQRVDLAKAAERVRSISPNLAVEAFMALQRQGRIVFEASPSAAAPRCQAGIAQA